MFEELEMSTKFGGIGGFLPGMKQIANVAALPGIVGVRSTIPSNLHPHPLNDVEIRWSSRCSFGLWVRHREHGCIRLQRS